MILASATPRWHRWSSCRLTRVKLDRALIASMHTSPRSAAIARALVGLCHDIGLEVTAEGIECLEQLLCSRT